jgi:hypothetical protein
VPFDVVERRPPIGPLSDDNAFARVSRVDEYPARGRLDGAARDHPDEIYGLTAQSFR